MTTTTGTPIEQDETARALASRLDALVTHLSQASLPSASADLVAARDELTDRGRSAAGGDLAERLRAAVAIRAFCYRHDLPEVLAASGAPHVYNYRRSFTENMHGPSAEATGDLVVPQPRWTLLGFDIGYPIGIPASVLTGNAKYIRYYARHAYNVITHQTVRSVRRDAHPAPNWVFIERFANAASRPADQPLPTTAEAKSLSAIAHRHTYPHNPAAYSMANSVGVPSPAPDVWQRDLEECLDALGVGQLLIASVMGSPEHYAGQELIDDFVTVARLAETTGVEAIELNLSCPNTVDLRGSGMQAPICFDPNVTREIVGAVRAGLRHSQTRLVAKLSYMPHDRIEGVLSTIANEVDAISGINTLQMRVTDASGKATFRGTLEAPSRDRDEAGVSGVAIRDHALAFVRSVVTLKRKHGWTLDVIGMGGVMNSHDVRALMASGADAVQSATAAANDPDLAQRLLGGAQAGDHADVVDAVRRALQDPRWEYRTAAGIAHQLNMDVELVRKVLETPDIARQSPLKDRNGVQTYRPADRPLNAREHLARVRWVLSR